MAWFEKFSNIIEEWFVAAINDSFKEEQNIYKDSPYHTVNFTLDWYNQTDGKPRGFKGQVYGFTVLLCNLVFWLADIFLD